VFLNIHHLFIYYQISANSDIKKTKFYLPIMLGPSLLFGGEGRHFFPKSNNIFFKRKYFVTNISFAKKHSQKNINKKIRN
jgi:hypothetical protein